jgi:hypothetical protein
MILREPTKQTTYPWKRQWRQWRYERGRLVPTELLESYEEVDKYPALVLWGEPGLGKTHEILQAYDALAEHGSFAQVISLGSVGRAEELTQTIHQSASYRAWQDTPNGCWTLFLDGFDEACVPHDLLCSWLCSALRRVVAGSTAGRQAHVRITSRAASWPGLLENELRKLWDWHSVGVYELQPLSRRDIDRMSPSADFIKQVKERGLLNLAQRPLTLAMLCSTFAKRRVLPRSAKELFVDAVTDARTGRNVSPVADLLGMVATVQLFGSRLRLWTGRCANAKPEDALDIAAFETSRRIAGRAAPTKAHADIREAIRNGPFTALGNDTFEWKHRALAEFLAARWLFRHGEQGAALFDLLSIDHGNFRRIQSHLAELARWLGSFSAGFRQRLVDGDHDVLLHEHMATATDHDRQQVLETLLRRFATSDRHEVHDNQELKYEQLNHPRLGAQLRPYLSSSAGRNSVRRLAIKVAEACNVRTLTPALVDIAHRDSDSDDVRARAVLAIGHVGSNAAKRRLLEMLVSIPKNDPHDEIRGCLLEALWPSFLSYEQLFAAIEVRKQQRRSGTYSTFVANLVPKFPTARAAVVALRWLQLLPRDAALEYPHLGKQIVESAFQAAKFRLVRRAIATLYIEHAKTSSYLFDASASSRLHEKYLKIGWKDRRSIIAEVLKAIPAAMRQQVLSDRPWPLIGPDDLGALLVDERILQTEIGAEATAAVLATAASQRNTIDGSQEANDAWALSTALSRIENSLQAIRQACTTDEEKPSPRECTEDWPETISQLVEAAPNDPNQWRKLDETLLKSCDSARELSEFKPSLSATPAWQSLPALQQRGLAALARRYLEEGAPPDTSWLGTKAWHQPSATAYRAFRLLAEVPIEFRAITRGTWKRWASAIVGLSWQGSSEELDIQSELAVICRILAPQEYLEAVSTVVERGSYPVGFERIVDASLPPVHDNEVWASLLSGVPRRTWPNEPSLRLATLFIARHCRAARTFAKERLRSDEDVGTADAPLSFDETVAAAFVLDDPVEAWPFLARRIERAPSRGRAILAWAADRIWLPQSSHGWNWLNEEMLADTYEWIRRWQASKDKPPGPLGNLGKLARIVLRELGKDQGPAARSQLERLNRAFPNDRQVNLRLKKAQSRRLEWSWRPYSATEVLALSSKQTDHQRRSRS